MRYLACSLIAEGDSDVCFLGPVLFRQLEQIALETGRFSIDQVDLLDCRTVWDKDTVVDTVAADFAWHNLVFVHNDHNERGKIDYLCRQIVIPPNRRVVGIVPVRETEAWMLADPEALRQIARTDPAVLPGKAAQVERLADPKATLRAALGERPRAEFFQRLGELVSLDRLAEVPAYQSFLQDLTTALKELNFR